MPVRETFSEFHYATCDEFLKRTMHYDHVYYNMLNILPEHDVPMEL